MVAFSCARCGMKLEVKDEFAGRQSKCPSCKQPLVVPKPSSRAPFVAPQQIGVESCLVKAGLQRGVQLTQHEAGKPLAHGSHPGPRSDKQRYVISGEIARGGMGAVLRAVDCDIRREVAVKYMLDTRDLRRQARFIEEAQINGQLEHPNIVPVYDLGIDPEKRPFILMKMIKGRSLKDVLHELREHPKQAEKTWSLGRLLNILVNVCNALAFAHSRGVIHRDLKPANIMLGDFGEMYVMDWGLAKVVRADRQAAGAAMAAPSVDFPPGRNASQPAANNVVTSRGPDADLTLEGAVIGTPVYMPPEQATGDSDAIDPRSDVYSLGAILYEILTLQPPVDKDGGHLAVLMRVTRGEIVPPEQRERKRARAGKIPRELSAIAMKALAKNKDDRYPTIEALRRDIELFQEGRSVSAKPDTTRELLWKLVKRNRALSGATVLFLLLLLAVLGLTLKTYLAYLGEQNAKEARTREAIPILVKLAQQALERRDFDDAFVQVQVALEYAPKHAQAQLLRGQLLIVRREYPAALADLEQYLQANPGDNNARETMDLCRKAQTDDASLLRFAEAFHRQKNYPLADGVLRQFAPNAVAARQRMLLLYRQRIQAAWPGLGDRLEMDEGGKFRLSLNDLANVVKDLTPLKGMPLTSLALTKCSGVQNLLPLKGMPLTWLDIGGCRQVQDLSPLEGMPLGWLNLWECSGVEDLSPLRETKLTGLALGYCGTNRDLSSLRGLKLTLLNLEGTSIRDLSPLQGMNLAEVTLSPQGITRGMDVLRRMNSLRTIKVPDKGALPAEEFWKKYDAGEFKN